MDSVDSIPALRQVGKAVAQRKVEKLTSISRSSGHEQSGARSYHSELGPNALPFGADLDNRGPDYPTKLRTRDNLFQAPQLPSLHWYTWTQGSHTSRWEAGGGKLMTVR
jgi:hypothetical protein